MNENMYLVIVDTRGMSPSQIDGYEEHSCTQDFFDSHVLSHPKIRCTKSKVAELCGLEMKIYFHDHSGKIRHHQLEDPPQLAIWNEESDDIHPSNIVNGAATLLTFDPRTGFPEYQIFGKAYVVVDFGDYPLSNHQVWGIQELIGEARDFYYCDPDHEHEGHKNLLTWCRDYREQEYGPLTIYEPRTAHRCPEDEASYYNHRHFDHHKDEKKQKEATCASDSAKVKQADTCTKKRRHYPLSFVFGRNHGCTLE